MPKGYLVANIRVKDQKVSEFFRHGRACYPEIWRQGAGKGAGADRHEGSLKAVVMMIEFESKEVAEKFYFSEEYQVARQSVMNVQRQT